MPILYLINPSAPPSFFELDCAREWGATPLAAIADLVLPTLTSMAEPFFEVHVCDERLTPASLDFDGSVVAITGKSSQLPRMRALGDSYRRRGLTVVMGGPGVTLDPEAVRDHCDVLVTGEIEEIAEGLFSDLARGQAGDTYLGTRPELETSPIPRWSRDLVKRARLGALQTSRGCPFQCEFCDVIQYLGRRQRFKPVANILQELDGLLAAGASRVFVCDDNFLVHRARAREVLEAVRDWNRRRGNFVLLATQASIDAARDPQLLELAASAGLSEVFIGVETPNEASLRETGKRQNVGRDLIADISRFLEHGILVHAGMMVGFDNDDPSIFERQFAFAQESPVPLFTLSSLVAPMGTPLYARLRREGRLEDREVAFGWPWQTNIKPAGFSLEQLVEGQRWLANNLYAPDNYGRRLEAMARLLVGRPAPVVACRPEAGVSTVALQLLDRLRKRGDGERRLTEQSLRWRGTPASEAVSKSLLIYCQVRHIYESGDFWDPSLVGTPPPR
ncbi:MAG: radical SAM protein [Vulcanimicrobiota bacterium]